MNKEFLFDLLSTGSVSGNETELEKKVYDYMQDKADQVSVDELGNVTAALNPSASFKVLLAGNGDAAYTKKLENYIKANGLKEAELMGFVEDVPVLLKQCDVGVICSEYEGFGLVTVEYMLNAMPVIGYRSGATPEIIEEHATGFLYKHIWEIRDAMEMLIQYRKLRQKYGKAGRKRAVAKFSAEANVKAVQKLLDETDG